MRIYNLEDRNNKSLYEFIYTSIKNDILDGVLSPDERLPSKRAFAANQGVSVVTVENAYSQLLAEGYIYSKPKSGFYVSPIEGQIGIKSYVSPISIQDEEVHEDVHFNLVSNHTPTDNFPFTTWARIIRRLLSEQDEKLLKAPPTGGVYELKAAIANHLMEFRGIVCDPQQIIIGAGTEYLYGLIIQLLGRNKIYGLENPSSNKIRKIYESLGTKTVSLDMDDEGVIIDTEGMSKANIIQLSPSHQFPLGVVTSVARRYALLQWAAISEDRYIIEDDYDSEFRLQGRPIPSLFSMDTTDKVIYFNTFTKSLSSTIRISYMVLPKSLLNQFNKYLSFYSCTVSNFEQYTLSSFIHEGYFEKHINRMRNHYRELRDYLIMEIKNSPIGNKISISESDSGIHFIMKIKTYTGDETLKKAAMDNSVRISFISEYLSADQLTNKYQHNAIVNYSGMSLTDINSMVTALNKAWGQLI